MEKRVLLSTPMRELGLGGAFNSWFTKPRAGLDSPITLAEFIDLNNRLMSNKDYLFCYMKRGRSYGFQKDSVSFRKLKQFLLDNNFTYEDWVLLLPDIETPKGKRPNLALLRKDVLLGLLYCQVAGVREADNPVKQIRYYYHEWAQSSDFESPLLVYQILSLTTEQVFEMPIRSVGKTLMVVQRKFKELGLTPEDGPFMEINFPKTKSKSDFTKELVKYRGFTERDARMAVQFGLRAGWIKL